MTEREAHLRGICEEPAHDLPRLVFADWLDERGESGRAGFIRAGIKWRKKTIQCTALQPGSGSGNRDTQRRWQISNQRLPAELRAMENQVGVVSESIPAEWYPPRQWEICRGFISSIAVTLTAFVHGSETGNLRKLFRNNPIEEVWFSDAGTHRIPPGLVPQYGIADEFNRALRGFEVREHFDHPDHANAALSRAAANYARWLADLLPLQSLGPSASAVDSQSRH